MRRIFLFFLSTCLIGYSCGEKSDSKEEIAKISSEPKDYIKALPGENEEISMDLVKKGEVLIAYADCYDCHREDSRAKGPPFKSIAARYPITEVYINHLSNKIINGSQGAWGYPIMDPHPKIPKEDAKAMVTFILSLRNQ